MGRHTVAVVFAGIVNAPGELRFRGLPVNVDPAVDEIVLTAGPPDAASGARGNQEMPMTNSQKRDNGDRA